MTLRTLRVAVLCTALAFAIAPCFAQVSENLLQNPSFEDGLQNNGLPVGWNLYGGMGGARRIELVDAAHDGAHAALIADDDPAQEIGITQTIPAKGGECYEASAMSRPVEGASAMGSHMQLRFLPSGEFAQVGLDAEDKGQYQRIAVRKVAPPDTKQIILYLYTHRDPIPKVMVDSVSIVSGVEPPPPPPPPAPAPIPPQYDNLKDLHLTTQIVADGQLACSIVAPASGRYDPGAAKLRAAIHEITGAEVPIIRDDSPGAAVPIAQNLIVLGNRSTNRTIEVLYNRYYCLTDLKYPGAGGHEVRTLHNPFGDGRNVIFAGGSDDMGVAGAADVLCAKLAEAGGGPGSLSVGRLMEIKLGDGIAPPDDVRNMEVWEASKGYGSTGYFGWCSISKHMAMYYMTGRPEHAREALRLSFPDAKALADISEIDGERIENKDDPLAGFYHYNAHMAILFWDLIEESDVFTDEERLDVTNAFARQLNHRKDEGIYPLTEPSPAIGSRHGQYSALSLYCLGRYFNKDYPDPVWAQCIRGPEMHFASLATDSWVNGESDNLFWYNTGHAPILSWICLSGDTKPIESGSLAEVLRGQEVLISGRVPDWALNSAALDYLHKAAYLTGDGRWITYRKRTGVDTDVFRLGQSYWPDESVKPALPTDLCGKWSVYGLSPRAWRSRVNGFERDESYYFAAYRSAPDETGDYILLDGFNGASRNPYHTHAILELRMGGETVLQGYANQLLTRADGMVEPQVAMDAARRWSDTIGDTAAFIADVPRAAYCNWRRGVVHRTGRYALVYDDLTFRADSDNIEVQTLWESGRPTWNAEENALVVQPVERSSVPSGWRILRARDADYEVHSNRPDPVVELDSLDIVLLRADAVGDWIEYEFVVPAAVEGEVYASFLDYVDRGVASMALDGEVVIDRYDNWADSAKPGTVSLGRRSLSAGMHTVRLEVTEKRAGSETAFIGFQGLLIRPAHAPDVPAPRDFEIRPADLCTAILSGRNSTLSWTGAVKQGEHRILFSLLAKQPAGEGKLSCVRIGPNAALLGLPEPAVATVTEGGVAVIASDHLFGRAIKVASLGNTVIFQADRDIDVDWDFATGRLHLVAAEETQVTAGEINRVFAPGRHELTGVLPGDAARKDIAEALEAMSAGALAQRREFQAQQAAAVATPEAPALNTVFATSLPGWVEHQIVIRRETGDLICAVEGNRVHILDQSGAEVKLIEAAAKVLSVHWWPEHQLLLVGCKDEKLLAFDASFEPRWEFTSVMDPAVFRAAKTYWFKTAPGHEGIHEIGTGVFLDGKSQAFLGSACTLEIIDENGQLVHRMPIFWGPGHRFQFIDGPEGSTNLLIAREPCDGESLAVINNRDLGPVGRSFYSVPPGHVYVGGWAQMTRDHIFYVDMDGDGKREVVTEINGVWNRITVWDAQGTALHNANFGPGAVIPTRNMRDLAIADLDADGDMEIITATSGGLVVALDHRCEKLWSKRMPSPPTVLLAITPRGEDRPQIVVGCEGGQVLVLDGTGDVNRVDSTDGAARQASSLALADGTPAAVLATQKGQVKVLTF